MLIKQLGFVDNIALFWYDNNTKGDLDMQVSLSELKLNVGKYVDLADTEEIIITRNGKPAARLIGATPERLERKVAAMKSLFGIVPPDVDWDALRMERISK